LKKILILCIAIVSLSNAEKINQNAILNILMKGAGKKVKLANTSKNNYKDMNNTSNAELPKGYLPNLPISSEELEKAFEGSKDKVNSMFVKVVNNKKEINAGEYGKEVKY